MANYHHYKYGGSTIELTGLCPGSNKARLEMGQVDAGPAANRGTRIHNRVEQLWADPKSKGCLDHDEETISQNVLTALNNLIFEHGFAKSQVSLEKQYALSAIHSEAGGTPDLDGHKPFGDMLVVDLKTGFVAVDPKENLQELFYACAVDQTLSPVVRASLEMLHLVIIQPEAQPPYYVHVRKWSMPYSDLPKYFERFRQDIHYAEQNPDKRIAGDWCRDKFCSAQHTCPVNRAYMNEKSGGQLERLLAGEKVYPTTGDEISQMLNVKAHVMSMFKSLDERAKTLIMVNPMAVPDWTLEDSLSNRAIKDEKALSKALQALGLKPAEYRQKDMLTPAALEKVLKARKIEFDLGPHTERSKIGVNLVKRTSVNALQALAPTEAPAPTPKQLAATLAVSSIQALKEAVTG